jgi:hypothetical protein
VDFVEVEAVSTLRRKRIDVEQVVGDCVERLFPGGFRRASSWLLLAGLFGGVFHGTSIDHSGRAGKQQDNRVLAAKKSRPFPRGSMGGWGTYFAMR